MVQAKAKPAQGKTRIMPALMLANLWKPLALVALLAGLAAYRAVLVHQRNEARTQAASLQAKMLSLQASIEAMKVSVAQQNAAVEEMGKRLQAARAAAQQREVEYARGGAKVLSKEIARAHTLMQTQVPSGCEGAIEWGNGQGPKLGEW